MANPRPLPAAAECVRVYVGVDRVSVTAIDGDRYELLAHVGTDLLPVGARFPLETSTHFLRASTGDHYESIDFAADRTFHRPLDQLVLSSGFNSGLSLPMTTGDLVVGALSLSTADYEWKPSRYQRVELEAAAGVLASHLAGAGWAGPLSVLVAHTDALIAVGLRNVLSTRIAANVTVVASHDHLPAAILVSRPDVVIVGEGFDPHGDAVLAALRDADAHAPLIFLAPRDAPSARAFAGTLGASAFISHKAAHATLSTVVTALARKEQLPLHLRPTLTPPTAASRLTRREHDVLHGLDRGEPLRDIARGLGLREATLKGYARDLYSKLGAHSRGEAVHIGRERGLIT